MREQYKNIKRKVEWMNGIIIAIDAVLFLLSYNCTTSLHLPNELGNLRLMANQMMAFMTAHYISICMSCLFPKRPPFNESKYFRLLFLLLLFYRFIAWLEPDQQNTTASTKSESTSVKNKKTRFANTCRTAASYADDSSQTTTAD